MHFEKSRGQRIITRGAVCACIYSKNRQLSKIHVSISCICFANHNGIYCIKVEDIVHAFVMSTGHYWVSKMDRRRTESLSSKQQKHS